MTRATTDNQSSPDDAIFDQNVGNKWLVIVDDTTALNDQNRWWRHLCKPKAMSINFSLRRLDLLHVTCLLQMKLMWKPACKTQYNNTKTWHIIKCTIQMEPELNFKPIPVQKRAQGSPYLVLSFRLSWWLTYNLFLLTLITDTVITAVLYWRMRWSVNYLYQHN